MSVTAERDIVRRVAEKQAVALLNLTPKQINYARELRKLFHQTQDEKERSEIRDAFLELVFPDGISKEGILDAGISSAVKSRVNAYYSRVGAEIRKRRLAKGLSQTALAKKAGIPQSHLSRLETGMHAPTHFTIRKLARALQTRPKMLDPGFSS